MHNRTVCIYKYTYINTLSQNNWIWYKLYLFNPHKIPTTTLATTSFPKNLQAINAGDSAGGSSHELVVVALIALRVDLLWLPWIRGFSDISGRPPSSKLGSLTRKECIWPTRAISAIYLGNSKKKWTYTSIYWWIQVPFFGEFSVAGLKPNGRGSWCIPSQFPIIYFPFLLLPYIHPI